MRLLAKLYWQFPPATTIPVIVDHFGIHASQLVAWAFGQAKGRPD